MLGVTLFGIFLTPVFFYVIQGFSEMPRWSTPRMQRLGFILYVMLNILFLGVPYLLSRLFGAVTVGRQASATTPPDTRIQSAQRRTDGSGDTRIQGDREERTR